MGNVHALGDSGFDSLNVKICIIYGKGNIEPCIGKMIRTLGFMLAACATWVLTQHFKEAFALFFGNGLQQFSGAVNGEFLPRRLVDETALCVGVAVGKGNVRLYVEDRRTIAQIGAQNMNDRTVFSEFYAL